MILIIGGAAQGKIHYAKHCVNKDIVAKIVNENYTTVDELYGADIIDHFHGIIKRLMLEENNSSKQSSKIEQFCLDLVDQNPDVCIVTNEIGYGIVPIDKFERTYRERTGRICCELASRAEEVHRVVCGIGRRIK